MLLTFCVDRGSLFRLIKVIPLPHSSKMFLEKSCDAEGSNDFFWQCVGILQRCKRREPINDQEVPLGLLVSVIVIRTNQPPG